MSKNMSEEERKRTFADYLASTAKPQPCESCDSAIHRFLGKKYKNPCKKGHEDSGSEKTSCEDHPDQKYHPK